MMRSGRSKVVMTLVVLLLLCLGIGGERVGGQVQHHVVGGDSGWTPSADLLSWLNGRVFRVGDKIWFAYPATEERILEVQTSEEFFTCDLSNPIRMYTNGLDKVSLETEGVRFFTSGNLDNCKNGLKLPVNVQPQLTLAAGPTSPSASARFDTGLSVTFFVALGLSYFVGLM